MALTWLLVGAGVVGLGLSAWAARQLRVEARADELAVFSGRRHLLPDGTFVGYRVVRSGSTWRVPFLERLDRLDLRAHTVEIEADNVYTRDGVPLSLYSLASVRISADPRSYNNAIERFLGRDPDEIRQVAKQTLEGHLRGVVARMTPEEVHDNRLKLSDGLVDAAGDDFGRMGLSLDTLEVRSVSDDAGITGRELRAVEHDRG